MLNFRGYVYVGGLANSQCDAWKFLSFFPFFITPTGRIFGYIPTYSMLLYVVLAKEKTQRSINFKNRHVYSARAIGQLIIFFWGGISQRSRLHGHIMYTAEMYLNSVLGDRIQFILGFIHTFEPSHNYLGTNCLPWQRRLPRNGVKNYGLMTTYFSTGNISNWWTCSPEDPCDMTHFTLADTQTKCTGCNVTNNLQ